MDYMEDSKREVLNNLKIKQWMLNSWMNWKLEIDELEYCYYKNYYSYTFDIYYGVSRHVEAIALMLRAGN